MDYKIIGQNIKKYRKNNKLTQSELAKKIERTESSIRKYEKGIVEIPMSLLEKIAEQLNISIDELTGNTSEKQSNLSNTDIIGYMAGLNTIRPGDKFTHLVYDIMYKPHKHDRIFTCTKMFFEKEMLRGCKDGSVKKIRVHDLRHSHASHLIELGFSPLAIADRLGHDRVETTLNTYSHLFPKTRDIIAESLQKTF